MYKWRRIDTCLHYDEFTRGGVEPHFLSHLIFVQKKTWRFYWVWDQQQQQVTGVSQNWDLSFLSYFSARNAGNTSYRLYWRFLINGR